jgi:DNA replication ATP-dependent helicase Dna2
MAREVVVNVEQVLRVYDEKNNQERFVTLVEDWFFTKVKTGEYVNIIGEFDPVTKQCKIDNKQNMIITHPDIMVNGTIIGESFKCIRKAVLNSKLKVNRSCLKSSY